MLILGTAGVGALLEHREIAGRDLRTELLGIEARWAEFASWLSDDAGDADGCPPAAQDVALGATLALITRG